MDTVSALVAELDVTEESLQGTGAPATAPSAAPAAIVPGPCSADKSGKGNAPAADKAAVTVYRRDGKPSAAIAASNEQLKSKLAAGKKASGAHTGNAAAVQAAAEDGHAEDHSPSNSRPTRQRGKAQPYWMGGAAPASSPAPREVQADPAESDNPMPTCQEDKPQPADAQQPKGNGTRTGKAKKAPTVAKRQTRTSPHKEQQQQPAKRSRAASKQQQNEEQLQHEAAMEDAAEAAMEVGAAAAAAVAGQVPEQPAKAADETVQAGSAETACTDDSKCAAVQQLGTAEDRKLVHQRDAVSQTAAVAPNRAVVVELQMLSILLPQS